MMPGLPLRGGRSLRGDPQGRPRRRHQGRPIPGRGLRDRTAARAAELLGRPPGDFGYRHTVWTASLLAEQFRREGVEASDLTVHQAGYRWIRPRFVLARRLDF